MHVNIHAFAAALLLLTAPVAVAQDAAPPAPPADPAADAATPPKPVHNKDDDVYCHTVVTSGSYLSTQVCHTQREWKEITRNSQATLNRMNNRGSGLGGSMLGH